jgi:hypothetical protein
MNLLYIYNIGASKQKKMFLRKINKKDNGRGLKEEIIVRLSFIAN